MLGSIYQQMVKTGVKAMLFDARNFARQYALAAQDNLLPAWRRRLRITDLLIIDDLQVLMGKSKTIEELFHTYEAITEHGGKIIATLQADSPKLDFLGARLSSRFLSGIILPISSPHRSELELFAYTYLKMRNQPLNMEICSTIAAKVSNTGEAEKFLNEFMAYVTLHQQEFDISCFHVFWEKLKEGQKVLLEPNNIINVTSDIVGVSREDIIGTRRTPKIVEARQLAIFAVRELCRCSYSEIGRCFNREHGTIIQACRQMETKLAANSELRERFEKIYKVFSR